jgi:hypothetical protein
MEHEEEFACRFDGDSFAEASQADDPPAFNCRQRWIHRPQQERARKPHTGNRPADDTRFERVHVEKNVWEFRHLLVTLMRHQ